MPPEQRSTNSGSSSGATATSASAPQPESDRSLEEKASHLAESVKGEAKDAAEDIKRNASQAGVRLREQCSELLDGQKEKAAEEVNHVSLAIHDAAKRLHETDDERLAKYADTIASNLDEVRDYLRQRSMSQLADDAATCARRRPELFFGGLVVVGLAAGRFLRASRESRQRDETEKRQQGDAKRQQGDAKSSPGTGPSPMRRDVEAGPRSQYGTATTAEPNVVMPEGAKPKPI